MERHRRNKLTIPPRYDQNQEPITISKATIDIILKENKPADLIALYCFYYYTAKWQGTNYPKATTSYAAQGLHWSQDRIRQTKKTLIKLGLVEDRTSRDKNTNKITGHYIYIKFILWDKTKISHTLEKPDSGKSHRVGKSKGNALNTINRNALSNNNKNIYPQIKKIKNKHLYEKLSIQFLKQRFSLFGGNDMSSLWDKDKSLPKSSVISNCIDTLDKLVRIDGYDLKSQVTPVLRWVLTDDFWSVNLCSLAGLRSKSKNGSTKFENIMRSYHQSVPEGRKPKALKKKRGYDNLIKRTPDKEFYYND